MALFGPTAIGKTEIAIALGERLREEGEDPVAISCDALQVYGGLETLTGAPTAAERARLEHRLVGFVPLTEEFSAGRFQRLAHDEVDTALERGRTPIVVGGTGLYLRAALTDLELRPEPEPAARERWEAALAAQGPEALHAELAERDPDAAGRIHPSDSTRIARALELLDSGSTPPAGGEQSVLWTERMRHPTLLCCLTMEREALYRRVDERMERIAAAGRCEAEAAAAAGASRTAAAALGFEEVRTGDVEGLKRRARNLAKRQLAWARRLEEAHVLDVTDLSPEAAAATIAERRAARGSD